MQERVVKHIKAYALMYGIPVLYAGLLVCMIISLVTFQATDASMFYYDRLHACQNMCGTLGANFAAFIVYLFGSGAYVLIASLTYFLFSMLRSRPIKQEFDRIVGFVLLQVSFSMLCYVSHIGFCQYSACGGLVGKIAATKLLYYFDLRSKLLIIYTLLFCAAVLILRFSHIIFARFAIAIVHMLADYVTKLDNVPARMVRFIAKSIAFCCFMFYRLLKSAWNVISGSLLNTMNSSIVEFERQEPIDRRVDEMMQDLFGKETSVDLGKTLETNQVKAAQQQSSMDEVVEQEPLYSLPNIEEMLSHGTLTFKQDAKPKNDEFDTQSMILEEKLSHFGIKGSVVRVHPGPVITLFEYSPDSRIKLSKIVALEDDLAMALQAISIRILAPIPGKSVVGFEVANKVRKPVLLADIFHSSSWTKFSGYLPLILGENTHGEHVVVDLASMPHLLIAGSTGSGKSVALNAMLVSLLCAKTPEELRLIIIDPKQIEFTAYEHIGHLLFPIVTDAKRAIPVLKWVVITMEERYEKMSELGVRNIFEYHKLAKNDATLEPMPFIVVIVDELADLMMTTGKDTEDLIARIAQMSRAAGIHMIIATQRPSVDVITGLIKVNFPNRISFKVTSKVDSRTILDEVGAERLLGKGDMLFIDAKDPDIKRVHGAYVSDSEIKFLVRHIKSQCDVQYCDVTDKITDAQDADSFLLDTDQKLYQDVVSLLKSCDEISISMIQRRFRIGYNRSARIIEALEANGLILPSDGGKMRRVVKD